MKFNELRIEYEFNQLQLAQKEALACQGFSTEDFEKERKELMELYTDSNIQKEKEELIEHMELITNGK